jgi:hypothetical protein
MNFDWAVRITDLVMILAIIAGPIAAVWISDGRQRRHQKRGHKEWVFRTLMTTRAAPLAPTHIDALNLAGLLFDDKRHNEPKVVDAWKLYIAHLQKQTPISDWWGGEREKLLGELLYQMAIALNYSISRSDIKNSTSYYPQWYINAKMENSETRKLWLEVLRQQRGLPVTNFPPSS